MKMIWNKNALAVLVATTLLTGCFSDDENAAADAGDDITVKERRAMQLSTATATGEGNVKIAWTQLSGPQLIITGGNTLTPTVIAQSVDADSVAQLRMIVTDSKGQVAEDTMSINIINNTLPILSGDVEAIAEKTEVSLTAPVTDDGEIRAIRWQQSAGPLVELSRDDTMTVDFVAPAVTELTALTFKLLVQDDDAEVAELEFSVDVTPTLVNVALDGQITGADFSGGQAILNGAAAPVISTVDENGGFSFTLQLDDDALDTALLAIEVTSATDSRVKYSALHSGFAAPVEVSAQTAVASAANSAEDDGSNTVSVTAVSTALYSLLVAANNGVVPANIDALMVVEKSIDADELAEAAAVVKILTDNPDIMLPEGSTDFVALLLDINAYNAFANQLETDRPGLIAATVLAIIADPILTPPLTAETVAPLYFQTFSAAPGFLSRGGERWQFNPDGSGSHAGSFGEAAFNWQLQDGNIELLYTSQFKANSYLLSVEVGSAGLTQQQVDWLVADNIQQVGVTETINNAELTRVTTGQAIDTFRQVGVKQLKVGPITTTQGVVESTAQADFTSNILMRKQLNSTLAFNVDNMAGTWALNTYYAVSLPNQGGDVANFYLDPLSFNVNGTGQGVSTGRSFTWQINEDKLALAMSDGSHISIEIMDKSGNDYQVFTSVYDGADNLIAAQADYGFKALLNGQAQPANLGSVYWQTMINSWSKDSWENGRLLFCQGDSLCAAPADTYIPVFGWQFTTGGTGNQYTAGYPLSSVPPTFEITSNPLSWLKTNPVSMNFTYGSSKRFWQLLKEEQGLLGRRLYVREENFNASTGARTIGGRINIYEEIPVNYWNETAPQNANQVPGSDVSATQRTVIEPTKQRVVTF